MAATVDQDGSEDVNDFLQRIKELGDKRDREDEERTRKLEEEILQGRKERQARRAGDTSSTDMEQARRSDSHTRPRTDAPSRASPLSWQRRPDSRASNGTLSRPSSAIARDNSSINASQPAGGSTALEGPKESSRNEIAAHLGAKDPSWFRQTPDRAASAAPRRSAQDKTEEAAPLRAAKVSLAGMITKSDDQPKRPPNSSLADEKPISAARVGSLSSAGQTKGYHSSPSLSELGSLQSRSPLPVSDAERLPPPSGDSATDRHIEERGSGRPYSMASLSRSHGRLSPERTERSPSPTKGMGGFVQSAMLKRSDSVNKRWSAQVTTGLTRGDSIASNKSGYDAPDPSNNDSVALASPTKRDFILSALSRENTPTPGMPSSCASDTVSVGKDLKENHKPYAIDTSVELVNDTSTRPVLSTQGPSQPIMTRDSNEAASFTGNNHTKSTPPSSPSKDQKRWSPSKASWLETALSKSPEKPRPKTIAPQQPAWMAEVSRTKQQRESGDRARSPEFKEVTTAGLMRAPPPGGPTKPMSIGGLPSGFSTGTISKKPFDGANDGEDAGKIRSPPVNPKPASLSSAGSSPTPRQTSISDDGDLSNSHGRGLGSRKLSTATPTMGSTSGSSQQRHTSEDLKKKPDTPPKKNSMSSVRGTVQVQRQDEPEFKNVFGRLRQTKTQNYVAPDELKNNILRGKAALNLTGGPKKTERRDDFKESLIKQKEAMKLKAGEQAAASPGATNLDTREVKEGKSAVPEAIAKRRNLGKSSRDMEMPKSERSTSGAIRDAEDSSDAKPTPDVQHKSPGKTSLSTTEKPIVGRSNPALAALIGRGPPSTTSAASSVRSSSSVSAGRSQSNASTSEAGPDLDHITKGRARGPKRRPPETKRALQPNEGPLEPLSESLEQDNIRPGHLSVDPRNLGSSGSISATSDRMDIPTRQTGGTGALNPTSSAKAARAMAEVSEATHLGTAKLVRDNVPTSSSSKTPLPSEAPMDNPVSVRGDQSGSTPTSHRGPRSNSPIKLSTRDDEGRVRNVTDESKEQEQLLGLGLRSVALVSPSSQVHNDAPRSPQTDSQKSSPKAMRSPPPPSKPPSLATSVTSNGSGPSRIPDSPMLHVSEAERLFTDFFGQMPKASSVTTVDTQSILDRRPDTSAEKLKTLRKEIWEVIGDGKKQNLPPDQEHVLFDGSMYLCTHTFATLSGSRKTEVYLWVGNQVSESAVEDAQLFSRKVARDSASHLMVFRQGRESSNFFQALGGIVVTRRGQSSRRDSGAAFMLCGRKHIGQIAFDEVDLSMQSLCSGYPYLLSHPASGKLYLWKGKGSGADELGCGRLIGMDLGSMGDIQEFDEGKEPEAFMKILGAGASSMQRTPDYWKMKPKYEGFALRLFCVDPGSRDKVREIHPFSQSDLSPHHIYCLDTFFSLYVIIPPLVHSEPSHLPLALSFAQDYGILAASLEDRPFVPVGQVVLGRVPKEVKWSFRGWDGRREGVSSPSTKGASEATRMVGLDAAVSAIRRVS
ncbi:MAG: hypothetical protein M1817_001036 [Caeruleum heppii]|nr:MAG: hypothetical protein M1817_001036 [Caeruleum heppii]